MEQKGKCFDNIVNWLQTQNSAFLNFELILLGVFLRILTFYFKLRILSITEEEVRILYFQLP